MNKRNRKSYEPPALMAVEFRAERGFALSTPIESLALGGDVWNASPQQGNGIESVSFGGSAWDEQ